MSKQHVHGVSILQKQPDLHDAAEASKVGIPYDFLIDNVDFRLRSARLTNDLWVYIPFVVVFVLFVLMEREVLGGQSFFLVNSLQSQLVENEFPDVQVLKTFEDIASDGDWYEWFEGVVIPFLFDSSIPDTSKSEHYPAGQNLILGNLRVRTYKAGNQSCEVNTVYFPENGTVSRDCYGAFDRKNLDTEPFPKNAPGCDLWEYQDSAPGVPTTGKVVQYRGYPTGGYIVEFPFNMTYNEALAKAKKLTECGYVDNTQTRFVTVEFFAYAPNFDSFVSAKLFMEVTAGGAWVSNHQFRLFKVWTKNDIGPLVLFFCFIAFVLYYVWKFIYEWRQEARRSGRILKFITELWNFLEFINLATFIAVAALRIWWVLQSQQANFRIPYEGGYPGEMEQILYSFSLQGYLNALNTVITFIKCLKFVRLNDNLNLLTKTLEICQQNIIGVLILFFLVVMGYTICGNTLFGHALWEWRDFGTSFVSLLRILLGDFDYPAMKQEAPALAAVFFWSYVILGLFMLLNFIIAIITDAFSKVKGEQNTVSLDLQITRAWKKLLRSFTWKKFKSRFFALGRRIRDMFLCRFGANSERDALQAILDDIAAHYKQLKDEDASSHDEPEKIGKNTCYISMTFSRYVKNIIWRNTKIWVEISLTSGTMCWKIGSNIRRMMSSWRRCSMNSALRVGLSWLFRT